RAIRFLAATDSFSRAVDTRRARIDRQVRSAIYAHCPSEVMFSNIAVPANARFSVGLGQVAGSRGAAASAAAGTTRVDVVIIAGSERATILNEDAPDGERWKDISVSLEKWAGKTVSLVLKASSASPATVSLWANPTVYQAIKDAPVVAIYLIDATSA